MLDLWGNLIVNIKMRWTSFWAFHKSYFSNPLTWFEFSSVKKLASSWFNHRVCQLCDKSCLASQCEWAHPEMIYTVWIIFPCYFFLLADHSEVSDLRVSSYWWCQGKNSRPALPCCPNPPALHWEGKVDTESCLEGLLFCLLRVHSLCSQFSFLACRLKIDTEVLLRFFF